MSAHRLPVQVLLAAAVLAGGEPLPELGVAPGLPPDSPAQAVGRRRPWWEHGGHRHSNGKLRKGTRPKVRAWSLKPQAPASGRQDVVRTSARPGGSDARS